MAENASSETKFCSNCKRQINANNFMMHEIHCRRHISLCTHCQQPIPKAEMDIHFEETHAKINCEKCGQAVEKMDLEKHEEQECAKRPMQCAYCEMDVSWQDLETHQDYCGTRTEACARCDQYIMIKDQQRHEQSNCTYPQPKPTNGREVNRQLSNGNGSTSHGDGIGAAFSDDMLFGTGEINPFTFDEIQRILTKPTVSGAASNKGLPSRAKEKKPQVKKSSDRNKKSDLNRLREQASSGQSTEQKYVGYSEEDDRLLALTLSDDLQQDSSIDQYMRVIDKPRESLPKSSLFEDGNPANIHSSLGDLSMLPCEFCGEAIPVDDLVIHQSTCIEDPLSSLMPQADSRPHGTASSESQSQGRSEDNRYRGVAPESRQPPPIINNLTPDTSAPQQQRYEQLISPDDYFSEHLLSPEDHFTEDFLLPCEFCEELFPHEILVQHQVVCTANGTTTPRPGSSPKRSNPSKQPTDELSRVRTRQSAPDISSILSESSDNRRKQNSSRTNDVTHSQRLKSTLGKYGVTADDTYQQRVERRALRQQNSRDTDEDQSPRLRSGKVTRGKGIAAKSTLDSLLHDDPPSSSTRPTHDLLGHVTTTPSTRKSSKDNLNSFRRHPGVPTEPGARSTYDVNTSSLYGVSSRTPRGGDVPTPRRSKGSVTARDVQQELDLQPVNLRPPVGTGVSTPRRTRNTQGCDEVTAAGSRTSSTTPGSGRRDRGNGIFSHSQGTSSNSNLRTTRTAPRRDRDGQQ